MRTRLTLAVVLASAASVIAEQGHAQVPQRTTATFDDWTVSCAVTPGQGNQKTCEMVQGQTLKDQPNPVGQVTMSRPAKTQPYRIFFQVPPNIWFQTGIKFAAQANQPPLVAQLRWCLPSRCLADADLTDAVINKLRTYNEPGSEQYKDAAQQDVSLSVSLKGFGPALDWMEKQ
jgi:invasion protein IalB